MVDASLGFKYQADVPLRPKPGKHEQCEVTESEVQIETTSVPRLNYEWEKKPGQLTVSSCWSCPNYAEGAKASLHMKHSASTFSLLEKVWGTIYVFLGADLACYVSSTLLLTQPIKWRQEQEIEWRRNETYREKWIIRLIEAANRNEWVLSHSCLSVAWGRRCLMLHFIAVTPKTKLNVKWPTSPRLLDNGQI